MRYQLILFFLSAIPCFSQVPENPEDISPLLIGEKFPDVKLRTADNKEISFAAVLDKKMTILIIYRGSWCPYCSMHLAEVGQIEGDLIALGYQVVAVSPDPVEGLSESIEKGELNYTLLSDTKGELIRAAGLAYKAPGFHSRMLGKNQQTDNPILPVPSLFIINESGEILFEYINPNYRQRISGNLLLSAARALVQ